MAKSDIGSGSILEAVARHEQDLVAKLDAAQQEADAIVADARSEAGRVVDERQRRLEQEILNLRREAEAARERLREELRQAAAEELERRRTEARQRTPQVIEEVIALILPQPLEGSR